MYFDIGANVGRWAKANIDKCNKIIAVEASPKTYAKLQSECKHDKIELLNFAVCNNAGNDVKFYQADWDTISTLNQNWLADKSSRFYNACKYHEIVCKSITMDNLIAKYGKPDLIKIDVEGGELNCISSLTQKVDLLCFEWAAELHDVSTSSLQHLIGLGFTKFHIQHEDAYTFRPQESDWKNIDVTLQKLGTAVQKRDWGMIWCK
jgi:FkbM family methyltransferase